MKHPARFLFGVALGIGLGYALTLVFKPTLAKKRHNQS